ncbi:MAG: DotA/TraY family protein, partial [Pseudomonadota bacterium]
QQTIATYFMEAVETRTRLDIENGDDAMQERRNAELAMITGAFGDNPSPDSDSQGGEAGRVMTLALVSLGNIGASMFDGNPNTSGWTAAKNAVGSAIFFGAGVMGLEDEFGQATADGLNFLVEAGGLTPNADAANPIASIISLGRALWSTGLAIMFALDDGEVSWGDNVALATLTSDDFSQSAIVSQMASGIAKISSGSRRLLAQVGQLMLIPGFLMGYLFPFLPWLLWIGGLVGWFILVMEAIIAAPLWALAHMRMDGEGIMGPAGQQGYMLALSLMLRPALMLIGLIAGMMLIYIMVPFIGVSISTTFELGRNSGNAVDVMSQIMMIALMAFVMITISYKAFGLIHQVPDRVLRWIGAGSGQQGEDEFRSGAMAIVNAGAIGGIAGAASGSDSLGSPSGNTSDRGADPMAAISRG